MLTITALSLYLLHLQPVSRSVEARRPDHSHSTHVWSVSSEAMVLCRDRDPSSDCFHGSFHPYTTQHPLTSYKPASVKASVCQATVISPRLRCGRTCSYSFNPPARFHVRSAESTGRLHRPNGVLSCSPCGEHLARRLTSKYVELLRRYCNSPRYVRESNQVPHDCN